MIIFGIVLVIVLAAGIVIHQHEEELMRDSTPCSTGFSVGRTAPMDVNLVYEYIEACATMSDVLIHITIKNQFVISGMER